jgi:hypothetical protein
MDVPTFAKRYSGRTFDPADIERVRPLIPEHPQATRQRLSCLIREALDWRKPDGGLKDMSCRVAMLRLHREGLIELPARRHKVNPCRSFARRTAQAEPQARTSTIVWPFGTPGPGPTDPVPGDFRAPLDKHAAKRVLKMILRQRKNSLLYANAHGAYGGDVLTSRIETCRLGGINPVDSTP